MWKVVPRVHIRRLVDYGDKWRIVLKKCRTLIANQNTQRLTFEDSLEVQLFSDSALLSAPPKEGNCNSREIVSKGMEY
jgi:hypothetical protein